MRKASAKRADDGPHSFVPLICMLCCMHQQVRILHQGIQPLSSAVRNPPC